MTGRVPFVLLVFGSAWCATISPLRAASPFTEEALTRGISYVADDLETSEVGVAGQSQGAAFLDLDDDGDQDLVLVGKDAGLVGVYENDGAGFFTLLSATGMPSLPMASSVSAGDYDADGDLDVYLSQFNDPNFLMRNDGEFNFTDVTAAANLQTEGATTGTTWGDYDGDGFLDLYVPNYPNSYDQTDHLLFHNLGDGTFEEVGVELGVEDSGGMAFQASFVDYDLDGDVDLYNVNDRGGVGDMLGNTLWQNQGDGTFVDVSAASGAEAHIFAMGLTVGDLDRNGWPDFYVSNIDANILLMNDNGHFVEQASAWGVTCNRVSWGVMFFDMDNDGNLDLYVCDTPLGQATSPAPRLYSCEGTPPCVDVAPQMGLDLSTDSFGVTAADIDDDGDLDILTVRPDFRVLLYVNHAETESNHWLKTRLQGVGNNRFAVGSTVYLDDSRGTQQRYLIAGQNYKSQMPSDLHFGVGADTSIEQLRVRWPDGETTCHLDVEVDQTLIVDRAVSYDIPPTAVGPVPLHASVPTESPTSLSWQSVGDVRYRVYFGASDSPPFLGETRETSIPIPALEADTTYFWRVDTEACVVTTGELWSFTTLPSSTDDPVEPDDDVDPPVIIGPTLTITSPADFSNVQTTSPFLTVQGTADDDGAVTSVVWTSDRGPSGEAVTDNSWTDWTATNIPLSPDLNRITFSAFDDGGRRADAVLEVTFTSDELLVAIDSPTAESHYDSPTGIIALGGTAGGAVTSVTWSDDRVGSGICLGTTRWTTGDIALSSGETVFTITAQDADDLTASAQIMITYVDVTAPSVTITSPTTDSVYVTQEETILVSGTALDNDHVAVVSWTIEGGANGLCDGTSSWLAIGVPLREGVNDLTITAFDPLGNRGMAQLSITRKATADPIDDPTLTPDESEDPNADSQSPENLNGADQTNASKGGRASSSACGAVGMITLLLTMACLTWMRKG